MAYYAWLKFRMKLSFGRFKESCSLKQLIIDKIKLTVMQKLSVATSNLQQVLLTDDGIPDYSTKQLEKNLSFSPLEITVASALVHLDRGMSKESLLKYICKSTSFTLERKKAISECIYYYYECSNQFDKISTFKVKLRFANIALMFA